GHSGDHVLLDYFTRLTPPHPFMTIAPQWDFLNLLAQAGADEPNIDLRMGIEATSLIWNDGRVVGVRARTAPDAEARRHTDAAPAPASKTLEFRAPLVIAADGRWSKVRTEAGLAVRELHSSIDVWWSRSDTEAALPDSVAPRGRDGKVFVVIPRRGHVQIARLIPKGADERLRAEGIEALRRA